MPSVTDREQLEIANADQLSFTRFVPPKKQIAVCYPETGVHSIPTRPPSRGGTVYDQYHKKTYGIADVDPDTLKYKKSKKEMFDMKMELKYGSPLVSASLAWGHEAVWSTTSRPLGVERGIIKYSKLK